MTLKTEIKTLPEISYVFVRHIGAYSECKACWHKLMFWGLKKNIINKLLFWQKKLPFIHKETKYFGLCYDDPDKVKNCRYDACFSITNEAIAQLKFKNCGNVQTAIMPQGSYVTTLVKGSYETFYEIYTQLFNGQTIKFEDIDFAKPTMEMYLNSPRNTKPKNLLTEIYIPLK